MSRGPMLAPDASLTPSYTPPTALKNGNTKVAL